MLGSITTKYHLHLPTMTLKSFDSTLQLSRNQNLLEITYTSNPTVAHNWMTINMQNHGSNRFKIPLGFDCEWKPTYRKGQSDNPPALLQLSVNYQKVLLFQIRGTPNNPNYARLRKKAGRYPEIAQMLSSSEYMRIGCSVDKDIEKMVMFHDLPQLSAAPSLDLSAFASFHYHVCLEDYYGRDISEKLQKHSIILGNPKLRLRMHHFYKIPLALTHDLLTDRKQLDSKEEIAIYLEILDNIDYKKFLKDTEKLEFPDVPNKDLGTIRMPIAGTRILRTGLQSLAERYLSMQIKEGNVSRSNWELYPLAEKQIIYAAIDAYVSENVYHVIMQDLSTRKLETSHQQKLKDFLNTLNKRKIKTKPSE